MNWRYYSDLTLAGLLSAATLPAFSAQIIYGFDSAAAFHKRANGEFYIQAGSFRNQFNANHSQSALKNRLKKPVIIKQSHGNYTVLIGPMRSAAEVRSVANQMTVHPMPTQPVRAHAPRPRPIHPQPSVVQPVKKQPEAHYSLFHAPKPVARPKELYKEPLTMAPVDMPPAGWFMGAEVGWADPNLRETTNYAPSGMPGFPDDKYVAHNIKNAAEYAVLAGYQWHRNTNWIPAYSLAASYGGFSSTSINGVIFENSLADSKNFRFKSDLWQQLVLLKLKVDLYRWHNVMPYLALGGGVAINKVHDYEQWPIPGATLQHKRFGFNSGSTNQFAGVAGAGLDYWIRQSAQISLGYQFTSSGSIRTGYGDGVLLNSRLSNKLYTNSLGLQGVYFLD